MKKPSALAEMIAAKALAAVRVERMVRARDFVWRTHPAPHVVAGQNIVAADTERLAMSQS